MKKYGWSFLYVLIIVLINIAFSYRPDLSSVWSVAVGGIFVFRDMAQRQIGHRVVYLMGIGIILSYVMASPFVALASAAAFACSEGVDWFIFTVTKRPLKDRILWSCAASAPIDSAVFLFLVHIFTPQLFIAQIISKMIAAVIIWLGIVSRDLSKRAHIA